MRIYRLSVALLACVSTCSLLAADDDSATEAAAAVVKNAESALRTKPQSVTQKAKLAPSGNPHDYASTAPKPTATSPHLSSASTKAVNLRLPRPVIIVLPLVLAFLSGMAANALAQPAPALAPARPMIWVTPADRAPILAKIEAQPWARVAFDAMKARVADAVAQHQRDPDAFLRGLPLVPSRPDSSAHPTLAHIGGNQASDGESGARGKLQRFLLSGIDCGVLYFLTGDESYARCTADILHATVEAMVLMKPNESPGNGGWIYPDDHLYEARALGAQVPLLYDFVAGYLRAGATVHNLAAKRQVPFDFTHAQQVFRTYARLAIEHGIINANWPVLEMPSLTHNVLALDDPAERTRLLASVTHEDTPHQDSLKKVVAEYAKPGAVWPESFQYSSGVSHLSTYLVALLRRQTPALALPVGYENIPLSLARLRDFRFPNGENIRFGDSPRRSGDDYDSYEIAYALGVREGDASLQSTFGALINLGVERGNYRRETPRGHVSGASPYFGPLQLLWYAPTISGRMAAPAPRTTDELGFVGAVLQRSLSPDGDPAHALMAVVSGGAHVHSHASGMSLELFGAGHVLGTPAGKGTYTTDDHENYRRLFAAYNCVIVNGASRSDGGWVNLGINTVEKISLEPAVGAAPVSPNHSFTLTGFIDDKGPGAKAKQERLVGLVRTSATTGYYVDVFRSQSALPEQFHDYLYHNIGDGVLIEAAGSPLKLADSPGRFVPVAGAKWDRNRSYLFPGWHVFKSAQTSAFFVGDVTVRFSAAKLSPTPAAMRLFIPGAEGREYSRALAPITKEAPPPYEKTPTPVLVIRQRGEAWTRPYAVIFEPSTGSANSAAIHSVTALGSASAFAGFKVMNKISGRTITQYILVQPAPDSTWADGKLGLAFTGRYAVVTLNDRDECTALYLGEGSSLAYKGTTLRSASGATTAASAELNGAQSTVTANAPAELTLPDGRHLASRPPGDAATPSKKNPL